MTDARLSAERGLRRLRWLLSLIVLVLALDWGWTAWWLSRRALPPGVHVAGPWRTTDPASGRFLSDTSWSDGTGTPLDARQIDAALHERIGAARVFIVLDAGLFGDLPATSVGAARLRRAAPVGEPIVEALIGARRAHADLDVLLLVDPASLLLGADTGWAERLRAAGIAVVPVDTSRLREPNPMFAALWRLCCWWAAPGVDGSWPNPLGLGPAHVSFGAWGRLAPFQRAHRQVLLSDDGSGGVDALLMSRPLHAEAGLHSSVALQWSGAVLGPLLESEFVVAQLSGWGQGGAMQRRAQQLLDVPVTANETAALPAQARVWTEGAIGDGLIQRLWHAERGQEVVLAALYLSDRDLVQALLAAAHRGVTVRVLLDPGKDGYGFEHGGLPNRAVASELLAASDGAIRVRWYRTHGEQFSPGLVLVHDVRRAWLFVGPSEFTRRELEDVNLAAALAVDLPAAAPAAVDALGWFDRLWYNRAPGGTEFTSDVDVYADASQVDYWKYRLLEASGAGFD